MEPPSAPPRGGHVPWQELLLAVSLLTFWNPPTTAQLTVESVPPNAAEGKDVLLRVHSLPGDLLGYNWFRGETVMSSHQIVSYVVDTQVATPGPAHSGRETIYPNGSLLLQRVTLNDTGNYTLQIVRKNAQVEQGTGQIRVFHGRKTTGLPVGSIIGFAVGVLVGLALTVALGCLLLRTRTERASGHSDLRELWGLATTPRHGPASSSIFPDSLASPTTAVPIYQELQHPNTNIYGQINHKAEMAS
ncbi:carcinoembryonic antigen-related cell adhesion molecule 4 isoform X5 [Ailuropoda melanoleuca]|uniref:carcinoembryonic antigen-related cell adhesion molecule 4 isoform X5 n=1 Tax=Ailuropoda melanoleuca TaxID=9646 RepID=UPI001494566F|nr:carcinoembryonic antigen-related cell adhesion molecule 4 isoform X5 [Ailuropoda melanoleuca]